MTDLTEFLRARLDEDEEAATEATQETTGRWTALETGWGGGLIVEDGCGALILPTAANTGHYPHIARHDPARVLREVEAKRRMLVLHAPTGPAGDDCAVCDYGTESCGCMGANGGWPCATIAILALPYAAHPDYRQEWKP